MVNKLWYDDEETIATRKILQKYIDLYCCDNNEFNIVEDITPENASLFLKIMLKNYENYHINFSGLAYDIGESLNLYFHRVYMDEFPDSCYPTYSNNDSRSLALWIIEYIKFDYIVLPEEVPLLLQFLDTSKKEIEQAHNNMQTYFKQFDHIERLKVEVAKRREAITKERIEAIENNQPLPIRPMSIELSLCYKDKAQSKSS